MRGLGSLYRNRFPFTPFIPSATITSEMSPCCSKMSEIFVSPVICMFYLPAMLLTVGCMEMVAPALALGDNLASVS